MWQRVVNCFFTFTLLSLISFVTESGFLPLLKNYVVSYKLQIYFVEGSKGQKYSDSSMRIFLSRSCKAVNIYKAVTPHKLKNSYTTHFLENGVGLQVYSRIIMHINSIQRNFLQFDTTKRIF